MPTTPPKTDPALERLAWEIVCDVLCHALPQEPPHDCIGVRCEICFPDQEKLTGTALQTLAPLAEVVEAARGIQSARQRIIDAQGDWSTLMQNNDVFQLAVVQLVKALTSLDAGREE